MKERKETQRQGDRKEEGERRELERKRKGKTMESQRDNGDKRERMKEKTRKM